MTPEDVCLTVMFCLQMPSMAAAERPAHRPKVRLIFSKALLSTAETLPGDAPLAAREIPRSSPETPELQAVPPLPGSKENVHPVAPRVRSIEKRFLGDTGCSLGLICTDCQHCRLRIQSACEHVLRVHSHVLPGHIIQAL